MKLALIALIISVFLLFGTVNALEFTSNTCNGNQLCKTTQTCDISSGCKTTTSDCQTCPPKTQFCPDGSVATCAGLCQSGQCGECTPICSSSQSRDTVVLQFNVYVKKSLNITVNPFLGKGIAGRAVDYEINIENKNPFNVNLIPQLQLPTGWVSSEIAPFSLETGKSQKLTLTVTSKKNSTDGLYPILFALFSNEIGTVVQTFRYEVSSNAAPSLTVTPLTQNSPPSGTVNFSINIFNNNGPEFDSASAFIQIKAPEGWQYDQPQIEKIVSGEEKNFSVTITVNDTPFYGQNKITINATLFSQTDSKDVTVFVSNCGDNICQIGESNTCALDCPVEQYFKCSGRCENEIDTGVRFSTSLNNFVSTKFIVCNKDSTPEQCEADFDAANCGQGQKCLCGNSPSATTLCSVRCVDASGAYYMTAKGITEGTIKSANYEYRCPDVNLQQLIQLRDNLSQAVDQFEQSRSVLRENIAGSQNASQFIPCYNGLGLIVQNLTAHVSYMTDVITYPAVSNTTQARQKTTQIRNMVSSVYAQYCRGASGVLRITNVQIPTTVEKGTNSNVSIEIQNLGSTDYNGFAQCDFNTPNGTTIIRNNTCQKIEAGTLHLYRLPVSIDAVGDWRVSCKVLGSLNSDCTNGLIHDQTQTSTFNVYSREVYVSQTYATCNQNVQCSVTTSRATADVSCSIRNSTCILSSSSGSTSTFNCTKPGVGTFNATGSVIASASTLPIEPSSKSVQFNCPGVGNDVVDVNTNEQCEPVNTINNSFCSQTTWACNATRIGARSSLGYCSNNAQCVPSAFTYSCSAPSCGAVCSDGDTKNFTITNNEGRSCVCVQQCGSACDYSPCSCEIPPKQLMFITPQNNSVVSGNLLASAFATYENSVNFGISSISSTCLGQYNIPSVKTLPNTFEFVLNTTSYSDGQYFFCAKTSTNLTTINIFINNNGTYVVSNLTDKSMIIVTPVHNSIVNGTITLSVFANYENNVNLGISASDPICSSQYNIPTTKRSGDRYETTIDTNSYQDGRYFLCAKSSTNLTTISFVIKNRNDSVVNTTPVYITPNNTVTDQEINQTCTVIINSKSCTYDSTANRYDITAGILWYGGNHSHIYVEGDEGPKFTEMTASRTYRVTGSGIKTIRAVAHDRSDLALCLQQATVNCVAPPVYNPDQPSNIPGDTCTNTRVEKYLSPAGTCQTYRVCEAPAGWRYVEKCPSETVLPPVTPVQRNDPSGIIIAAVILVVIMIFIIIFRKDIAEWIEERRLERVSKR